MNFELNEAQSASMQAVADQISSTQAQQDSPAKKGTIAATIIAALRKQTAPAKVLAQVLKKHKGAKTSIACVYWYKSRMNRGLIV